MTLAELQDIGREVGISTDLIARAAAHLAVFKRPLGTHPMELYAKYNKMAMPNMQLNRLEVSSVIEFMATESRRVASMEAVIGKKATGAHGDHHAHGEHHH